MKIVLDSTLKSLEIKLAGVVTTNELDWTAHWVDVTSDESAAPVYGSTDGTTNGTTAVTMVAAPASGHTRTVIGLSVTNNDTVAAIVTLQYNDNSTKRRIYKATFDVDDNLLID
jgi:hypothetical protein